MTTRYNDSADNQLCVMSADLIAGMYDSGTSSEFSASSLLYGYEQIYSGSGFMRHPPFPVQYPTSGENPAFLDLIPVTLDIEGNYEEYDRRKRRNDNMKAVASHVHSRRRAQNRASQKAFRDRKEKHTIELEQQLKDFERRYSDLARAYESLQVKYSSVKLELEVFQRENAKLETFSAGTAKEYPLNYYQESEDSRTKILDPLLFDGSAICFDQELGDNYPRN